MITSRLFVKRQAGSIRIPWLDYFKYISGQWPAFIPLTPLPHRYDVSLSLYSLSWSRRRKCGKFPLANGKLWIPESSSTTPPLFTLTQARLTHYTQALHPSHPTTPQIHTPTQARFTSMSVWMVSAGVSASSWAPQFYWVRMKACLAYNMLLSRNRSVAYVDFEELVLYSPRYWHACHFENL